MYKAFLFLSLLFVSAPPHASPSENTKPPDFVTLSKNSNAKMTATEKKVRLAAVRVQSSEGGHGSGSLIAYKGLQFVLTAEHVVDDEYTPIYMIEKYGVHRLAIKVYADKEHDIAVLYLPEGFTHIKAIKFEPYNRILEIGEEVTFSGYPSSHQLMTIRGRVAGYESVGEKGGTQIIIHTYGWLGSSGSAIYTSKGKIAGILWGIDIEYPLDDRPRLVEDMMWVVPIKNLKIDQAVETVCENFNTGLKACR